MINARLTGWILLFLLMTVPSHAQSVESPEVDIMQLLQTRCMTDVAFLKGL